MKDNSQQALRFRFQLRTLLAVVAFVALLLVNGILWVRLKTTQEDHARVKATLKSTQDQYAREKHVLATIKRELCDQINSHAAKAAPPGDPITKSQR